MERAFISAAKFKAVELAIMAEASTIMREMDPMKKETKEKAFLNSYVNIICKITDSILNIKHAAICSAMRLAYKGARTKVMEEGTEWRKYKSGLNDVRKFALKFPGVGNLSKLPSAKWNSSASANGVSSCCQAMEGKVS